MLADISTVSRALSSSGLRRRNGPCINREKWYEGVFVRNEPFPGAEAGPGVVGGPSTYFGYQLGLTEPSLGTGIFT